MAETRDLFVSGRTIVAVACVLTFAAAVAGNADHPDDSHYSTSGFFDIHVCNWPDRQPFYLALYSTASYDEVESIHLYGPDDRFIGELPLDKYRPIKREGRPDKRVFMDHIPIAADNPDGWYRAEIRRGSETDSARDFVFHQLLRRAEGHEPADGAEDVDMPQRLRWNRIDGAAFYQVFIRDQWNGGELVYSSKLMRTPWIDLPAGLLEPGGYYAWKVHARDVDGHIQLGDFNSGSQSRWVEFTVSPD